MRPVGKSLRSDGGLPFTFWVIGIGGNVAIAAVDEITRLLHGPYPYQDLYLLLAITYFIYSFFRVWEAAGKYAGPVMWRRLARLVMLAEAVIVAFSLILYAFTQN